MGTGQEPFTRKEPVIDCLYFHCSIRINNFFKLKNVPSIFLDYHLSYQNETGNKTYTVFTQFNATLE